MHIRSHEGSIIRAAAESWSQRKKHIAKGDLVKKQTFNVNHSPVSDLNKATVHGSFISHIEDTENWRGDALT